MEVKATCLGCSWQGEDYALQSLVLPHVPDLSMPDCSQLAAVSLVLAAETSFVDSSISWRALMSIEIIKFIFGRGLGRLTSVLLIVLLFEIMFSAKRTELFGLLLSIVYTRMIATVVSDGRNGMHRHDVTYL
jgi:hypothetical protein